MKTLKELQEIREKMKSQVFNRSAAGENDIKVIVGMATCGIASGARDILMAFNNEIQRRELKGVTVTQTGCIGLCRYEPIVEVRVPGSDAITYVKVTTAMVKEIITEHIIGGSPILNYTYKG